MKKGVVIFTGGYPIGAVSTHRVHHLCKGLVENDVALTLLLTHATESAPNLQNLQACGQFENVAFEYVGKKTIRHKNLLLRKAADAWCHLLTLLYLLRNRPGHQFVLVIGPSLDFRAFIPFIARMRKIATWLEINEYPYVTHEKSWKSRLKRAFFLRAIVPWYQGFVVISEKLETLLQPYKNNQARIIRVPILIDPKLSFSPSPVPIPAPYIIHSGAVFEEKDGVLGILEALALLKMQGQQPCRFVITGRVTAAHRALQTAVAQLGLEQQVIFSGYLSEGELYAYIKNSALAIVFKKDTTQNQYCFATKLGLYLVNAVPVIMTNIGEARHFFVDRQNAYVLDQTDSNALAACIHTALSTPEQSKAIAEAGQALCHRVFHYSVQGKRLAAFIQ